MADGEAIRVKFKNRKGFQKAQDEMDWYTKQMKESQRKRKRAIQSKPKAEKNHKKQAVEKSNSVSGIVDLNLKRCYVYIGTRCDAPEFGSTFFTGIRQRQTESKQKLAIQSKPKPKKSSKKQTVKKSDSVSSIAVALRRSARNIEALGLGSVVSTATGIRQSTRIAKLGPN